MKATRINGAGHVASVTTDAAVLIWRTYGVSSKIGRHAERTKSRAQALAFKLDDPLQGRAPNRFNFAKRKHLSSEQHIQLGRALKDCARLVALHLVNECRTLGKSHPRIRYWRQLAALVSKFKCKLDDLATAEHKGQEVLSWYYGDRA